MQTKTPFPSTQTRIALALRRGTEGIKKKLILSKSTLQSNWGAQKTSAHVTVSDKDKREGRKARIKAIRGWACGWSLGNGNYFIALLVQGTQKYESIHKGKKKHIRSLTKDCRERRTLKRLGSGGGCWLEESPQPHQQGYQVVCWEEESRKEEVLPSAVQNSKRNPGSSREGCGSVAAACGAPQREGEETREPSVAAHHSRGWLSLSWSCHFSSIDLVSVYCCKLGREDRTLI